MPRFFFYAFIIIAVKYTCHAQANYNVFNGPEDKMIISLESYKEEIDTCVLQIPLFNLLWHNYVFYSRKNMINPPAWLKKVGKNNTCSFEIYPDILNEKGLNKLLTLEWKVTINFKNCQNPWFYMKLYNSCQEVSIFYLVEQSFWNKLRVDSSAKIINIKYQHQKIRFDLSKNFKVHNETIHTCDLEMIVDKYTAKILSFNDKQRRNNWIKIIENQNNTCSFKIDPKIMKRNHQLNLLNYNWCIIEKFDNCNIYFVNKTFTDNYCNFEIFNCIDPTMLFKNNSINIQ
ncbi:hypothetical protein HCN44_011330 [Aphidius gifuensis]|uniref:Odorant-binding protein n=1 Tax=Aphidius gifuensis TaxID=684658 RepID=A0A834XWF6_APHGI|nr:hypothetical protein HCN44_011330 [Aphidius gifuensis]